MADRATIKTRRFFLEVSVDESAPVNEADAADELLEYLTSASLPQWVFSVNGVDPE